MFPPVINEKRFNIQTYLMLGLIVIYGFLERNIKYDTIL